MSGVSYPIFDTDRWTVTLSPNQAYLGRAVIASRRHITALSLLDADEWQELHSIIQRYEAAVTTAFGATMFNWTCLMNDAFKTLPPTPSVHWHVWPRYQQPVKWGQLSFTDPDFAHHYDKTRQQSIDDRHLRLLIMEIQRAMHVD